MVNLDSATLFKPFLAVLAIRSIFLFLEITNPINLVIGFLYFFSTWSLSQDGRRFKLIFIAIVLDFIMLYVGHSQSSVVVFSLFIVPLALLLMISIVLFRQVNDEYNLFKRTVISFNKEDRIKARKALKTLDPIDISEVAVYRDWNTVSR